MSDLSITHGGISTEKKTGGEVLSNNKKLNQMKVDLINVTLTTIAAAIADNEVVSQSIEIPNAVSVKGGSAIIQSAILLDEDYEGPAIELLFSKANTAIADALSQPIGNGVGDLDSTFRSMIGSTTVSNYTDLVDAKMGVKNNIGLVVQAQSDTTSLYVHAINRSGGAYTPLATTNLKLKLGIVKD